MKLNFVKTGSLLLSGIVLIGVFAFQTSLKTDNDEKIFKSTPFYGFAENTKINVNYYADQTLISEEITTADHTSLPQTFLQKNQYQIDYNIKEDEQNYLDLSIKINKKTDTIHISAQTEKPKTPVSVTINNTKYIQQVPTDWTGGIELSSNVTFSLGQAEICFTLDEANKTICHVTPPTKVGA